jgi:hypothetical protein
LATPYGWLKRPPDLIETVSSLAEVEDAYD